MKKLYESPLFEVEKFTVENIVTESGGINDNTGEGTLPPVNTLNEF